MEIQPNVFVKHKTITRSVTLEQIDFFAYGGFARQMSALRKGWKRAPWRDGIGFESNVQGTLSEGIWADTIKTHYVPLLGDKDTLIGDVAGFYNIKSSYYGNAHLVIQPHDLPKFVYLLAIIRLPVIEYVGWLPGDAAMTERHFRVKGQEPGVKNNCFWIDQKYLNGMDTVPLPPPLPQIIPADLAA